MYNSSIQLMDNISGTLGISSQVLLSMMSVFALVCFMVLIYKFTHNILVSLTTACIVCIVLSMIGFVPIYIVPIICLSVLLAASRKFWTYEGHKTTEKIDMGLLGISHDDFVEFEDDYDDMTEVDEKPVIKDKRAWGI